MGRPKKRLFTDLGSEMRATRERASGLESALCGALERGYVGREDADELSLYMDDLGQSMKDLRAALTEDDWE